MSQHPFPAYAAVIMFAIGLALAVFGAVLASNYRGVGTSHATRTINFMAPIRRRSGDDREQAIDRQIIVDRVLGVIFCLVGILMTVIGLVLLSEKLF